MRRLLLFLRSQPELWIALLFWPMVVLLALLARAALFPGPGAGPSAAEAAIVVSGLIVLGAVAILAARFHAAVRELRKRLFNGEYEHALEVARRHPALALGFGFESALSRLLKFDQRRAEKVAASTRLLDRLMREAPMPILIGDLDAKQVRFSRALCELFEVDEGTFSLESLILPPANQDFANLWNAVAGAGRTQAEATLTLHLPVRQAAERLELQLFAVQDDQGTITYVLGFAQPAPKGPEEDEQTVESERD